MRVAIDSGTERHTRARRRPLPFPHPPLPLLPSPRSRPWAARAAPALLVAQLLAHLLAPGDAGAQEAARPPIQDNSFLIEEAYNQERGVVQHVGTFSAARRTPEWLFTFTQEWPLRGRRHQLSYMVPLAHGDAASGGAVGVGDVMLNYRYQIAADATSSVDVAPRLSIVLPTGAHRRGLGAGGAALQVNLPASVELTGGIVAHSNLGATLTPAARDDQGRRARTTGYALGQSAVWLAHPALNLMVEALWTRDQEVVGEGRTAWRESALVAPGVRGAIDFPSGLQVVPGLAFPLGVGRSRGERGIFFYLSFEHAFAAPPR